MTTLHSTGTGQAAPTREARVFDTSQTPRLLLMIKQHELSLGHTFDVHHIKHRCSNHNNLASRRSVHSTWRL